MSVNQTESDRVECVCVCLCKEGPRVSENFVRCFAYTFLWVNQSII